MTAPGIVIAAPASASGKTTVTLAILRALRDHGVRVVSSKVGPDYIDPAYHAAASGRTCFNLDPWAMRPETLAALIERVGQDADLVVVEGVMGLFDGAANGAGSTADLAALAGWPVVLVIDGRGQGASAAALVRGFRDHSTDVTLAGVIVNRVGSDAHAAMIGGAIEALGVPLLGCLPRDEAVALPSRHLGLVQAREHGNLEALLDRAAAWAGRHLDLDKLHSLARPSALGRQVPRPRRDPPLGQRIAVAHDDAFAFLYPHVIEAWRATGAAILPFSPLADESPDLQADAIYLPGGYPELHAGRLAANGRFLTGLSNAATRGTCVFGECGGYMAIGEVLIDREGAAHRMAGLLPLETSFAAPKLHLGYREAILASDGPLGPSGTRFRGHEFHYATVLREAEDAPLFDMADANGKSLGPVGIVRGRVAGSFIHLIDRQS